MTDPQPDFDAEAFRAGRREPDSAALEVDLARLLWHRPDLEAVVAPILAGTQPADPALRALHDAVLAGVSKHGLRDRLGAASVGLPDAVAWVDSVCDRELLDHADRAVPIAQAVARQRLEAAVVAAGAAGDVKALAKAFAALEARTRAAATDDEADTCHWHGKTDASAQVPLLIEGLAPRNGIGLIAGQFAVGKSLLAMNLSAAVVTGLPFMGRAMQRIGGVLWFAAEGGETVVGRLAAAIQDLIQPPNALPPSLDRKMLPLAFYTDIPVLSEGSSLPVWLKRVEHVQSVLRAEYGCDLALIVVDTFSTAVKPADANDTAEAEVMMGRLREVATAADCLLLAVDHYGKDKSTGVRNSSVKEASSDVTFALLADRGEGGEVANTRVEHRKFRAGRAGYCVPYSIEAVTVEEGDETFEAPVIRMAVDQASEAHEGAAKERPSPKSLKLFLQTFDKMLNEAGEVVVILPDMPKVLAVREDLVRAEWMKAYPAQGDTDEKRKAAAQRAYRRSIERAQADRKLLSRDVAGVRWLWNPWRKD